MKTVVGDYDIVESILGWGQLGELVDEMNVRPYRIDDLHEVEEAFNDDDNRDIVLNRCFDVHVDMKKDATLKMVVSYYDEYGDYTAIIDYTKRTAKLFTPWDNR